MNTTTSYVKEPRLEIKQYLFQINKVQRIVV